MTDTAFQELNSLLTWQNMGYRFHSHDQDSATVRLQFLDRWAREHESCAREVIEQFAKTYEKSPHLPLSSLLWLVGASEKHQIEMPFGEWIPFNRLNLASTEEFILMRAYFRSANKERCEASLMSIRNVLLFSPNKYKIEQEDFMDFLHEKFTKNNQKKIFMHAIACFDRTNMSCIKKLCAKDPEIKLLVKNINVLNDISKILGNSSQSSQQDGQAKITSLIGKMDQGVIREYLSFHASDSSFQRFKHGVLHNSEIIPSRFTLDYAILKTPSLALSWHKMLLEMKKDGHDVGALIPPPIDVLDFSLSSSPSKTKVLWETMAELADQAYIKNAMDIVVKKVLDATNVSSLKDIQKLLLVVLAPLKKAGVDPALVKTSPVFLPSLLALLEPKQLLKAHFNQPKTVSVFEDIKDYLPKECLGFLHALHRAVGVQTNLPDFPFEISKKGLREVVKTMAENRSDEETKILEAILAIHEKHKMGRKLQSKIPKATRSRKM